MRRLFGLFAVLGAAASVWGAQTADECRQLRHHGLVAEARACFRQMTLNGSAFNRAEGFWGLRRFDEANDAFRAAEREHPKDAAVKVEWGSMYLDHYQPGDAAKLFGEALEIAGNNAQAYLGLASVAAEGYDKKAQEFAGKALRFEPKLAAAHELLARLALEDNDSKLASEEVQKALAITPEALNGMAVMASIDWLKGKPQSEWTARIAKINPHYGEAYATGGHFFEINRRYEEAIAAYRKALELEPDLWVTRSQLGLNFMRVGADAEARDQLEQCFEAHYRDAQTVNGLRLLDSLKDYEVFKSGSMEVMLHKKEATLLRPYIEPQMAKAMAIYEHKYKMKLAGPVRLEVYPNHDDFIVRTLGLPGQGGLLGVTFGTVVAMDSPSARAPGEFNWASTMWHEMSHVYVLTATNHLTPRWFTEGLAVHEEGAAEPDWGDRMTPEIVAALKEKKLLPVLELDRGFVRPEYPAQVIVSYFEAGKMCDYIAERWGNDAFLGMMHSYAARKTTAEAIEENLHEPAAVFDRGFAVWIEGRTGKTVQRFEDWKEGMKAVHKDLEAHKDADAIEKGLATRDLYPEYIGGGSTYESVASAYLSTGNKAGAMEQLERYRDLGGKNTAALKQLAGIEQETGKPEQAINTLMKLNNVFPEDEDAHRRLGGLLFDAGRTNEAVREYRAVLALAPPDVAESHYDLAKALRAAHREGEAKEQVVTALEAAPNFKPAQQLLLQLSQ